MRQISSQNRNRGFTLVELMVVTVALGILITLVAMTYNGVQAKNRNTQRQKDVNALQTQLETFYAQSPSGEYPSLTQINDASWRAKNMPKLTNGMLSDPHWSDKNTRCSLAKQPTLSAAPAANCYAYQVTDAAGNSCDNASNPCAHYTLTAALEGGQTAYVKSSLN